MGSSKPFRVVIIDDNADVIKAADKVIDKIKDEELKDTDRIVVVRTVEVKLKKGKDGKWDFDNYMQEDLERACIEKPDLILLDYIYIDRDEANKIIEKGKREGGIDENDLEDIAFGIDQLKKWIGKGDFESTIINKLFIKNIFESRVRVYLYSYTSEPFLKTLFGGIKKRVETTKAAFGFNADVIGIDINEELYNDGHREHYFDKEFKEALGQATIYKPGLWSEFHSFLVASMLNNIVRKEILRQQLEKRKVKIKGPLKAVTVLGGIAVGFGAFTQAAVDIVTTNWGKISFLSSLVLSVILFVFLIAFAIGVQFWMGKGSWMLVEDDE